MSEIRVDCPHCGSTFNVMVDGEPSSMMVFCCARCQTPLMYYHGETSELDREEFANLRKRLSKVLDVVMKQEGAVSEAAQSLKKIVEASNHEITEDNLELLKKSLDEMDAGSFIDSL